MRKNAISPTRAENYPEWYQQVIIAAELAENSPVRGCMVIKPWGYAIWELIQQQLDERFKETGHVNAYFPLLIPLSHLQKEAQHVEGFAKECAVVTHSRLTTDADGNLQPEGKLEEPYVIRPTSETIIGEMYSKWVQSYRDLPILINQWANVMRWEMRTRLFLRTSEFLWQEGHTVHATADEAVEETLKMLGVYEEFAHNVLALPVIKGEKTPAERFPGAVNTYCIESLMQDNKALQAGTSHFLGQNFSKASNIQFSDKDGTLMHAWTTSWGVSTRLIGGIIMTHSDDDGLSLPPRIAPQQIVVIPIYRNEEDRSKVMNACHKIKDTLAQQFVFDKKIRLHIDDRDIGGGTKNWEWIKKGVPLRVEIGPRDLKTNSLMLSRRDRAPNEKESLSVDDFIAKVEELLTDIQNQLFKKAEQYTQENTREFDSLEAFKKFFEQKNNGGFAVCYAADDTKVEEFIKPLKVTARCIPLNQDIPSGECLFTGKKISHKTIFSKSY
jgi:prolyl-tRNA synthetase